VSVERYHAVLDSTKMTALMKSVIATLGSAAFQAMLSTVRFTGGSLDATLNHAGQLVTEAGAFDITMDPGALGSSLQGSTILIHAVINGHFHDYGAAITVTPPSNVIGTVSLP